MNFDIFLVLKVGCCSPDNNLTKVTCGHGASCSGQCSAIQVEKRNNIKICRGKLKTMPFLFNKFNDWSTLYGVDGVDGLGKVCCLGKGSFHPVVC